MRRVLLGMLIIAAGACGALGSDPERVEIRLRNATGVRFDSVRVVFPANQSVQYGQLGIGATSAFHAVDEAYAYALIHAYADTSLYAQVPIDYVGEEPLSEGRYTYRIVLAQPGQPWLASELIIDEQ